MRHGVWRWVCVVFAMLGTTALADAGSDGGVAARHKPIAAGSLTLNPYDIVAVYKPAEQAGVAVYLGRPGQAIQTIIIKDARDSAAIFNAVWDNAEVTKDAGEDDARPLTRMRVKDSDARSATLVLNVQRVMAVSWDSDRRSVRVHFDKLIANDPLPSVSGETEAPFLEIPNVRDAGVAIVAAYRNCVYRR
jgi:hypothetical protein